MSSSASEAGAAQNMGELLDSIDAMKPARRGDIVEGVVMRADADGIFVNIGHKAEGIVPPNEMRSLDTQGVSVGDQILTFVIKPESADQAALLSIDRAIGERAWHDLEKMVESAETVEGKVAGFNRGGAIVEVQGIQGFVPMSQLVSVSRSRFRETRPPEPAPPAGDSTDEANVEREDAPPPAPEPEPPDPDLGKVLELKVLEINRSRNRAIFSERQAIQERRNEQKARLIETLTEGEVRRGKVTGISSFGAFVDLGGADGLIHISELSWTPVKTPEEVVKMGDELDVFVLRVDAVNKKIALSLRRLQPEPWETIHEHFQVGDVVEATITKLTNFGAFARVQNYVEGLIHISELTTQMINHPREVVSEGQSLQVRILRIEPDRRRMGLSLRQLEEETDASYYGDEE
jgi:small subunit ribosomal protein S1